MRRATGLAIVALGLVALAGSGAPASAAHCGGNDKTIDVVTPGFGKDEKAAVADAERKLPKDRTAAGKILDAWAAELACPLNCKHKYDLGTKEGKADLVIVDDEGTGFHAYTRWNAARAAVEVQEGQRLTRTVECFTVKAEQLMAARGAPGEIVAIAADPSGRRWRLTANVAGRVVRADALDPPRAGQQFTWHAGSQAFVAQPAGVTPAPGVIHSPAPPPRPRLETPPTR